MGSELSISDIVAATDFAGALSRAAEAYHRALNGVLAARRAAREILLQASEELLSRLPSCRVAEGLYEVVYAGRLRFFVSLAPVRNGIIVEVEPPLAPLLWAVVSVVSARAGLWPAASWRSAPAAKLGALLVSGNERDAVLAAIEFWSYTAGAQSDGSITVIPPLAGADPRLIAEHPSLAVTPLGFVPALGRDKGNDAGWLQVLDFSDLEEARDDCGENILGAIVDSIVSVSRR